MKTLAAVLFSLCLPATLLAASDPEDLTKLLQDADRALAEPKTPEKAPAGPLSTKPSEPSFEEMGDKGSEATTEAALEQPPAPEDSMDPPPVSAGDDVVNKNEVPPMASPYKVWIWQENGDTLWRIAQKVYGDKDKWKLIYLANKDVIKDPNKIYPKQKLKIPPADWQP